MQVVTCYEFVGKSGACKFFIRYIYNALNTAEAGGLLCGVCVVLEGVQRLE